MVIKKVGASRDEVKGFYDEIAKRWPEAEQRRNRILLKKLASSGSGARRYAELVQSIRKHRHFMCDPSMQHMRDHIAEVIETMSVELNELAPIFEPIYESAIAALPPHEELIEHTLQDLAGQAPNAATGEKVRRPFLDANVKRHADAAVEAAQWQEKAEAKWSEPQHAHKSASEIARLIAPDRWSTVRRKIRKPPEK